MAETRAKGVVDTSHSPYCRLEPVPIGAVQMGAGFWRPRMEINARVTIPKQLELLEETGALDNFRRVYGASDAPFRGRLFSDSDAYKWLEAAALALQSEDSSELGASIDQVIALIAPAQGDDGYLNSYFQFERADARWTKLETDHELYCAGHLFQAAVAHHRSTGKDSLLSIATRYADYICQVFGPDGLPGSAGHPEVEMGLVELYRETGETRYAETAGFFIDQANGKEMREILGHAVRALYFCAGMADYYGETGAPAYLDALESLWRSMVETKMYVTGAVGGRVRSESFGRMFELPNENAYAETCAAIASLMWNWRMLMLDGEARFADLMELTLYNSILSGISLDGETYFYVNPHASNGLATGDPWYPHERKGAPARQSWFGCACCPPNIARTFAAIPGHIYSTSRRGLWVHLYDNNSLNWQLADGTPITCKQSTGYPRDGRVEIELSPATPNEFSLYLRIPGWCQQTAVKVNGVDVAESIDPGRYHEIRRTWSAGDRVTLEMSMPVVPIISNPMAPENRGSIAAKRGPLVYCFEASDNPGYRVLQARASIDRDDPLNSFSAEHVEGLLEGVTLVRGSGSVPVDAWGGLYRPFSQRFIATRPVELVGIPYYAWANRGDGEMTVWLQVR